MRAFKVFASMTPEHSADVLAKIAEKSPLIFHQGLATACTTLKIRPVYLKKQPFDKRASSVRRALSLVSSNDLAEETLAIYFLECRRELLVEWLDTLGVDHEEGTLGDSDPVQPDPDTLATLYHAFLEKGEDPDRSLLTRAFASQNAIDWPALDRLIESDSKD